MEPFQNMTDLNKRRQTPAAVSCSIIFSQKLKLFRFQRQIYINNWVLFPCPAPKHTAVWPVEVNWDPTWLSKTEQNLAQPVKTSTAEFLESLPHFVLCLYHFTIVCIPVINCLLHPAEREESHPHLDPSSTGFFALPSPSTSSCCCSSCSPVSFPCQRATPAAQWPTTSPGRSTLCYVTPTAHHQPDNWEIRLKHFLRAHRETRHLFVTLTLL